MCGRLRSYVRFLPLKIVLMSFVTAAFGAVINVVLNILLIPKFENSAMGAAIATFASYLVVMIIRSIDTRRFVKFSMGLPKLVFNTLAVGAQAIVMTLEIKYFIVIEIAIFAVVLAVNGRAILSGILRAIKNFRKK